MEKENVGRYSLCIFCAYIERECGKGYLIMIIIYTRRVFRLIKYGASVDLSSFFWLLPLTRNHNQMPGSMFKHKSVDLGRIVSMDRAHGQNGFKTFARNATETKMVHTQ